MCLGTGVCMRARHGGCCHRFNIYILIKHTYIDTCMRFVYAFSCCCISFSSCFAFNLIFSLSLSVCVFLISRFAFTSISIVSFILSIHISLLYIWFLLVLLFFFLLHCLAFQLGHCFCRIFLRTTLISSRYIQFDFFLSLLFPCKF